MTRPDFVHIRPDGWQEQIRVRKRRSGDGSLAYTWKLINTNGITQEVWHEVVDATGRVCHRHPLPITRED